MVAVAAEAAMVVDMAAMEEGMATPMLATATEAMAGMGILMLVDMGVAMEHPRDMEEPREVRVGR